MAKERVQRRLAAILAADVVGYSRLMEADEAGTVARLKALREEVLEPTTARFGGRIFKTMGDGTFAEFPSAFDALQSAVELQGEFAARNAGLGETEQIALRIGISLGDVIVDGDDLYGNGVNVAARLESLAAPAGICVSGNVYEHVSNNFDSGFEDLGEQTVKNLTHPIRIYAVRLDRESASAGKTVAHTEKASIAILPFTNMSGDPEQEYFSDGISEDIITALSRARWFRVVSRNSAFAFKGSALNVRQVADELGVRYVLEGSVRKAGNRVRITAQLIDGSSDDHIWAERYDRELDDVFEVQDQITASIAAAIEPELRRAEFSRAMFVRPDSLTVWDIYQRGLWHMYRKIPDNHAALDHFEQATKLDPNFGLAYSGIADACFFLMRYVQVENSETYMDRGMAAAQRAVELDDDDPTARLALVRQLTWRRDYEEALVQVQHAIRLNPYRAEPRLVMGRILTDLGRFSDAKEAMQEALTVCPNDVSIGIVMARLAEANLHLGDFDQAIHWSREAARQRKSPVMSGRMTLISALGHKGDADGSEAELKNMLEQYPQFSLAFVRQHYSVTIPGALDLMIDGLRKAGVPEN